MPVEYLLGANPVPGSGLRKSEEELLGVRVATAAVLAGFRGGRAGSPHPRSGTVGHMVPAGVPGALSLAACSQQCLLPQGRGRGGGTEPEKEEALRLQEGTEGPELAQAPNGVPRLALRSVLPGPGHCCFVRIGSGGEVGQGGTGRVGLPEVSAAPEPFLLPLGPGIERCHCPPAPPVTAADGAGDAAIPAGQEGTLSLGEARGPTRSHRARAWGKQDSDPAAWPQGPPVSLASPSTTPDHS